MTLPSIEFEMRLPVARWILSRGLVPVCEVQSLRNCDLVGVRFEERPRVRLAELVAVELKLRDVAGVLRQCEGHVAYRPVTEVWAAMLPDVAARNAGRFSAAGVGLLAVRSDGVDVIHPAPRTEGQDLSRWLPAMRRRRHEYQWRMKHPLMLRYGSAGDAGVQSNADTEATDAA